MARHISILSLLLSVYLMSASAWGLALGDINLKSNLNQPFRAEITVEGANRDDVTGLTVQLASRAAFDRLGLDYPEYLQGFNLRTELRPDGNAVVIVTSSASVTEPFVTILVEATWARGRLLREYTVFLDPPTFVAPAPAPAPVQAPSTATESRTSGTVVRQPPPPPAPRAAPADQPAGQPFDAPGDSYRVQRNDTLWKIADRYRPDNSVSVNQMMMAIYEANPNAFMGQNINLVRAGSILRIPDRSAVTAISAAQANAEVARQYDEWRSGSAYSAPSEPVARLELRPPSEESSPGVGGQPVTGDAELTKENVELRDELAGVRDELEETQRLLQLRDEEMAQLQQRLQAIEEAESEVVTPITPAQPEELAPQPETEPAAETETPPAPVQPAARPAQPAADESLFGKVISFVTAPVFLILLGLGVIVAALLAVLRRRRAATEEFVEPWDSAGQAAGDSSLTSQTQTLTELPVRARGEESIVVEEGVSAEDTGSMEIPVFEPRTDATGSFELPDFETTAETTGSLELPTFDDLGAAETPAEPLPEVEPGKAEISAIDELSNTIMERLGQDQGDPIGEADFHMAYGLYDQAADVVRSALNKAPERRDLRAKLAEIYFVWGNKDQFLQSAQKLFDTRDEGADSDWDKILIMGKQIAPEEPIFSGELRSSVEEPVDLALEATAVAPPVDLSLAEEDQGGVDLDFGDALETGGDTRETPVLTDTGAVAEEKIGADAGEDDEGLDFDFSGDTQESPTLETVAAENPTLESPTIESVSLDAPTMETPAVDVPTIETPTLETPAVDMPTMETPTLETPGFGNAEELADTIEQKFDLDADSEVDGDRTSETAEIDLDDLGLDVNLDDSFLGPLDRTGQAEALAAEEDEDLTAAEGAESTGIRKVDFDFSEETAEEDSEHAETETLAATDFAEPEEVIGDEDATMLASALPDAAEMFATESESVRAIDDPTGIDLDLGDMIDAAESAEFGDTVEQPGVADAEATASADGDLLENVEATGIFDSPGATGIFESPESTGVLERPDDTAVLDLDIGEELRGVDDDPTATEVLPSDEFLQPAGDAVTMSEIGTKLDLARAYMDMGDPDGARSILEEVLDEGDEGQRADAERLIKSLS
jgi:pilus assembly protein FimV